MKIHTQRLTCKSCGRIFDAEMVMDAPVAVWAASVEAVTCPQCGAGFEHLSFGGAYRDAPPLTASIEPRAAWWKQRGDTGTSSETIWAVLSGAHMEYPDIPHDPDDFNRCRQLLLLIPEWRRQLPKVALRYDWWKVFVDNWEELDAMFTEEDARQWKKPNRMYGRMKQLETESRRIRAQGEQHA